LQFADKPAALHFFQKMRQLFKGWNSSLGAAKNFKNTEQEIIKLLEGHIKK